MSFFQCRLLKQNVEGTQNVIRAAAANGVKKVICLSTDKAAYPINAMGISKAMMEKVAIAEARNLTDTVVCLTRYGNVMASRGSVIPLFINQIKSGLPQTVPNSPTKGADEPIIAKKFNPPSNFCIERLEAICIELVKRSLSDSFLSGP